MTFLLIIITCAISIFAFNKEVLFSRLQFNAYQVVHRKEWYRLISHGFIHANWWHLFVNMFVLYFFGSSTEAYLKSMATEEIIKYPLLIYLLLYLAATVFSSSISLFRYKDNHWYNAVGASGAVSALLFFTIFFNPWGTILVYFIPVPGIIFAVLYIIYSQYMSKRGGDNIGHDAHLLGSVFGFIFPLFLNFNLYKVFIDQLFSVLH
jgi:membrane associated rhomboid family serine protease